MIFKTQRREISILFWRFFRDVTQATRFRKLSSKLLLWGVHSRGILVLHQVWSLTQFCHLYLLFRLLPMPQLKIYSKTVQIIYHEKVSKRGKVIKSLLFQYLLHRVKISDEEGLWAIHKVCPYTTNLWFHHRLLDNLQLVFTLQFKRLNLLFLEAGSLFPLLSQSCRALLLST